MAMFAGALVRDGKSLVRVIMGECREVTRSEGFAETAPVWIICHY